MSAAWLCLVIGHAWRLRPTKDGHVRTCRRCGARERHTSGGRWVHFEASGRRTLWTRRRGIG